MKRTLPLVVAFTSSVLLLRPSVSHATAPSLVEPAYEAATKTLSVTIRHWSLLDSLHYVKTVEIRVNGALLSTNTYSSQPSNEYTYSYTVAAVPGDVVEVAAKCNLWGSRVVELTIP